MLLLGSIARGECTQGSDVDFYAVARPALAEADGAQIVDVVLRTPTAMGFAAPLNIGPFAQGVFRDEIEAVSVISDDPPKIMRRMTLVVASTSIYQPSVRDKMLRRPQEEQTARGSPRTSSRRYVGCWDTRGTRGPTSPTRRP